MKDYGIHKVWRVKELNDEFFEVVFSRRRLDFISGSAVDLFSYPDSPSAFIASGKQEPWVRVILDKGRYSNFDMDIDSIKICRDTVNLIPDLFNEESPNFLIDSYGVSPFLSYVSTFPNVKCKVCYVGDNKVAYDWIKSYHKIVTKKEIRKCNDVYVIGEKDYLNSHVSRVINTCKHHYFI